MTKKILFLFAMILGFAMQTMAAKAAAPDSVFVVKNGRIVSAYEVGKDVDNITFAKKAVLEGNSLVVGDEVVNLKSALVTYQGAYMYVYLSVKESVSSVADVATDKYVQIVMTPSLLDENINFDTFADDFNEEEDFFQMMYMDPVKYEEEDDYEPIVFSFDEWSDYFSAGSLYVNMEDDNLKVNFDCKPLENGEAFAGQYEGEFVEVAQNPYFFNVDGKSMELRSVFQEKVADGIAFYLTPGNIDNATDLVNTYYYARLFVPTKEMDGTDIDINGNREYELTFYDNVSDINNPQQITLSNGKTGNATGYVSVLDRGDGSYTLTIDVENMGNEGNRSFQAFYRGTPAVYDLTLPSEYTVAGSEPVTLKSCVVVVDSSDEDRDMYTVYLSSKEGVTTVEGMADADIVLTVPDDFINDDMTHGFSGTDINAMLSVAYGGDTYCQATTSDPVTSIAVGGNIKATLNAGKGNFDFMVFGASKFGGNIKGHYEGEVTKLTK